MAKQKPPKRLFKNRDRISGYQADRSPKARMKRMAREHEDVLQNIEFALVSEYRQDPAVDDGDVLKALQGSRIGTIPVDSRASELFTVLASVRELREDVADGVWIEALRVVEDSVRRHSSLRPGDTAYLDFAGQFVP